MNAVLVLLVGCAILIAGYIFYGGWLAKQWGVDDSKTTPAHELEDGMDYVPAKAPVLMGHHFSSIAGAGPINGPIQAAVFGWLPCMLWILIGGIFFGAVHDYGALFASIRHKGQTLVLVVAAFASIVAGTFNGFTAEGAHNDANASVAMVSILFIVMAIVFGLCVYRRGAPLSVATVVGVIGIVLCLIIGLNFHPIYLSNSTWMWIIGVYILIASVAPVWILLQPRDYLSSFLLYGMMIIAFVGIVGAGLMGQNTNLAMPAFTGWVDTISATSLGTMFPALFVTIACGALSGFHATQSPLMSRCLTKESYGRPIFYGAMIGEGFIALIWATVGMTFYQSPAELQAALASGGPANVVNQSALSLMGSIGGILAVLGVIVLPITSGDTAFRAARLTIAEVFNFNQTPSKNRLSIAIPLFIVGAILTQVDFNVIWRYFGWSNQTLACIMLWAGAAYLYRKGRFHWIASIPATFMTSVVVCYICMDKNLGFGIDYTISVYIGIAGALIAIGSFLAFANKNIEGAPTDD